MDFKIRNADMLYQDIKASTSFERVQDNIFRHSSEGNMDVMVMIMPETRSTSKSAVSPYGSYEVPRVNFRRQLAEEPMTEAAEEAVAPATSVAQSSNFQTYANASTNPALIPQCHASLDSCNAATNNCSGNGKCFKKYGSQDGSSCFSCGCVPTVTMNKGLEKKVYWGGSACNRKDVSAPFWLLAGFSVVMVGLVSWSIGLLFSIGEEKLPGVIGAGVSGVKAR
jgi:hypothetical protein